MNADEIKLALRFVAMGRVNHPQVEEFADKLAGLFARDVLPVVEMGGPVPFPFGPPTEIALVSEVDRPAAVDGQFWRSANAIEPVKLPDAIATTPVPAGTPDMLQAKRGPGRPKKAG